MFYRGLGEHLQEDRSQKTNDDIAFENNNTEKVKCVNIAGKKQRQVYRGRQRAF